METKDLLTRMKNKESGAYLEFSDKYSWSLYSAVRKRFSDSEMASKIYNEAINGFYQSLNEWECDDPIEALLLSYANGICYKNGVSGLLGDDFVGQDVTGDSAPPTLCAQPAVKKTVHTEEKKKDSFLYCIGSAVMLAGIAATMWVIAGILMDIGLVPEFDLGYTWFNVNIAQWF